MHNWLNYWRGVFKLAWESTRDHWRAISLAYLVLPFLDFVVYYTSNRTRASEAFHEMALLHIIPFTLAALFLTILYLVIVAPYRLHQTTVGEINQLSLKIAALEKKLAPAFSFRYEPMAPYVHEGANFKLARIGIYNESYSEPLTDVHVKLQDVIDCQLAKGRVPTPLHFKGDNKQPEDKTPHKTAANINPRDELLVDVVQWCYDGQRMPWLQFCSVETQIPGEQGRYEYDFVIHVTARNMPDGKQRFKTALDGTKLVLIPSGPSNSSLDSASS